MLHFDCESATLTRVHDLTAATLMHTWRKVDKCLTNEHVGQTGGDRTFCASSGRQGHFSHCRLDFNCLRPPDGTVSCFCCTFSSGCLTSFLLYKKMQALCLLSPKK